MAGLGAPELLIVLVIILFIFGSSKLPQLARSLGSAKREFEHGQIEQGRAGTAPVERESDPARVHAAAAERPERDAS